MVNTMNKIKLCKWKNEVGIPKHDAEARLNCEILIHSTYVIRRRWIKHNI